MLSVFDIKHSIARMVGRLTDLDRLVADGDMAASSRAVRVRLHGVPDGGCALP